MEDSILNHVYTLQEMAIALNVPNEQTSCIYYFSKKEKLDKILFNIPVLEKFKPFLFIIKHKKAKVYVMSAKIFDQYLLTGLLPETGTEYREPDISKKEYWQYESSNFYELSTKDNWDFALNYFKQNDNNVEGENIWDIFLAGCARMNYYQDSNTDLDTRIKYAIVEYMMRRPQFFTTDDFIDNPLLHKQYGSDNPQNRGE